MQQELKLMLVGWLPFWERASRLVFHGIESYTVYRTAISFRVGILGPSKEKDGVPVPPGKTSTLPTDHLITDAQEKWFIHKSLIGFVGWLYFKHLLDVMTS